MASENRNAQNNVITENDFDVLIIGAGLSGIGMACHLSKDSPNQRFAILERRQAMGGTWDLFRYPGIRSDSDMFSFGYGFRPWNELKVLADGPSIRHYIHETADAFGVTEHIRYGLKTTSADWSEKDQRWTVTVTHEDSGETETFTARFMVGCTGYYNYDKGYLPDFPGMDRFKGRCVHPQQWPEDLDYKDKKVVVIGSGATAVTLVPSMAEETAHITMLQRSPSYIFSIPGHDKLSEVLDAVLPSDWVFGMARWRNIKLQRLIYKASKKYPNFMRKLLLSNVKRHVGDGVDMAHFSPSYMPWDERLCAVPDADLFKDLRDGKATIVTDHIETFTENGILLKSGRELEADIIVTATGLNLQVLGGMTLSVDGAPLDVSQRMTYKGVLMEGVPNMAWVFGYTNASWTLKADLAAAYVCRVLNYLEENRLAVVTPRAECAQSQQDHSIMDALGSGYVQRASHLLPRQGQGHPWKVMNHYAYDRHVLLEEPVEDGFLAFV